jgi:hypothetical protein
MYGDCAISHRRTCGRARCLDDDGRYDREVRPVEAIVSCALIILAGSTASAQPVGQPLRVELEVGQSVALEVENAIGWFCDDPSLVSAEMIPLGDHNDWVVTGAKAGRTQCRIGTELGRATYMVDVEVLPPRE